MNPIRALLWKEGREAAYKIAAGAGLALLIGLGVSKVQGPAIGSSFEMAGNQVGLLGAVLMGMGVIAGERRRNTLSFLLSRPLSPIRLLAVKFTVGAVGLLVMLAAYWSVVYLWMPEWVDPAFLSEDPAVQQLVRLRQIQVEEMLKDFGYGRMVLLWFFLYLMLYAAVFLSSVFTDRPLTAALSGLMVAWIGLFLLIVAAKLSDLAGHYIQLVFNTDLYYDSETFRQAVQPRMLLVRAGVGVALAAGSLLWTSRAFTAQACRRFPWIVGAFALICGVIVVGLQATYLFL